MSKILFIQEEGSLKFGSMSLSAVLKQAGHQVEVFIELFEKETVFDFIDRWQPDFVAFSIVTMEKDWAVNLASKIKKKHQVYSVFGGVEPTYSPEIINHPAVDFVCRGEGEKGFLELVERLEKGKSLKGINNFWVKEKGKVIKNKLGRLVSDLDELPPPDWELYFKYPILRNLSTKKILCSRGCPYDCTYCFNHAYKKLFQGMGKFTRFRSPKSIINEIKEVRKKYGMKRVHFADETFTMNHQWLFELLDLYRKEVKLPFSCLARANEINEEVIRVLKKSGCFYIDFGIESGSERIRNKILRRNMSDEDIFKVAKLMKKYKLPFLAYVMYVLPTETLAEAFQTVEMNIKIGTDSVWGSVFQPFKGTDINRFCLKKKLLSKKTKIKSIQSTSVIKNPYKKQIENLRKLDWLTIKLPWLFPLTKKLVFLPNNPLFELSLKISQAYSIRRRYRLTFWEMFRIAWGSGHKFG